MIEKFGFSVAPYLGLVFGFTLVADGSILKILRSDLVVTELGKFHGFQGLVSLLL